ncbi:SixA phosphatase family protein [Actibacterium sp. XHP0104]|uniref:SixA phosphatase family protein n=1 Tax=Actibacterium sp. XHP0104 TaxID=2984335 RepID=UPI0021E980DC|nr:phosphoglycerate mutase family protein [Actibacterium sp. XHP0104]MCV2881935.1 histidine phosphatase family protein [Actibacterium sp. XHP0104]
MRTRLWWAIPALILALASTASAQEMLYVIRHAEKADAPADPPLTEAGRSRAAAWATMLRDSGIDVVFTSDAARSRETGQIIATALGVDRTEVPLAESGSLADLIQFDHEDDTVLVVGHTETIPGLIAGFGATIPVTLDHSMYDYLFVLPRDGALLHLHMP